MKKLGFGLMRLPLIDEKSKEVNIEKFKELVDYYMSNGYNYFDTAHTYLNGNSEKSIKKVLVSRYPRDSFYLASKLPIFNLEKEEDMEKIFNEQLGRCGVKYFDYYMLHNLSTKHYQKCINFNAFNFIEKMKNEGKIKHIGISCHDSPDFLDEILEQHPEIEFVQLQINYLDWNDKIIQSKGIYEVSCKYNKPIIIMEGLKGGALANLPDKAKNIIQEYDSDNSIVSWSFRYNLSLNNILVILSGMNKMEDLIENINIFESFSPLNKNDYSMLNKVSKSITDDIEIKCTGCEYCINHCSQLIDIPKFFNLYNSQKLLDQSHSIGMYYRNYITINKIKASDCIKCGKCIDYCPQKINIPKELEKVVKVFE